MHISKLLPHVNLFSQVQGTIHNSVHWYVLFRFWLFCFLLLFFVVLFVVCCCCCCGGGGGGDCGMLVVSRM